ncbi:hypothetical protein SAMN05443094_11174 [Domibacillus enclensis]|uniref:Uncharacterized protein n=1 Tax=Domibacillus enclensis TaxID=1017273 RepID=A0A1N7C4W5_9BACI|nr:hypothetical protein SAMN05443094_11174 [Domibacillus enclensis]
MKEKLLEAGSEVLVKGIKEVGGLAIELVMDAIKNKGGK